MMVANVSSMTLSCVAAAVVVGFAVVVTVVDFTVVVVVVDFAAGAVFDVTVDVVVAVCEQAPKISERIINKGIATFTIFILITSLLFF